MFIGSRGYKSQTLLLPHFNTKRADSTKMEEQLRRRKKKLRGCKYSAAAEEFPFAQPATERLDSQERLMKSFQKHFPSLIESYLAAIPTPLKKKKKALQGRLAGSDEKQRQQADDIIIIADDNQHHLPFFQLILEKRRMLMQQGSNPFTSMPDIAFFYRKLYLYKP